ncbi:DUF6503 family protein [Maribacter sp. 2307ULW6-5]|uniref:DUF6503 family protein n=1 Tax=Maribacter sp. 2307ULW6-5 TaxID=3386275 RepID=UPI0039BD3C70
MRTVFCLLLLFLARTLVSQELTGKALLEKAIAHHDPQNQWPTFTGALAIVMTTPDGKERHSRIALDLPRQYYKSEVLQGGDTIVGTLHKTACSITLNGSPDIPEQDRKRLGISCERVEKMRNYYTYLYGLPMKLKDPGTHLDPKVERVRFNQKEYLRLRASYDPEVGTDTWYFYFDPDSFAMEAYQFFHDETKNDGEYILLSETMTVNAIKMPKIRSWHYNRDGGHLGTDVLIQAQGHTAKD